MKRYQLIIIYIFFMILVIGCIQKDKNIVIDFNVDELIITEGEQQLLPLKLENCELNEITFDFDQDHIKLVTNVMTALKPGEIIIKAIYKNNPDIYDQMKVIILKKKSIQLTINQVTIPLNLTYNLPVVLENLTFSELGFSYSIPNTVVIEDGIIRCLNIGEVKVTVYCIENPSIKDDLLVSVENEKSITFSDSSIKVVAGDSVTIPLSLKNLTLDEVTISSSNNEIIALDGLTLIAKQAGEVDIYVQAINYELIATINVIVEAKKTISFMNNLSLKIDSSINLGLKLENIDYDEVIFEYDQNALFVENNLLFAKKAGFFTIKALYRYSEIINSTVNVEVIDYTINEAGYWIKNLKSDPNQLIMNRDSINLYNKNITDFYSSTKVVDLNVFGNGIDSSIIYSMINSYSSMNSYNVYKQGQILVTSDEKNSVLANRALTNIPTEITLKYGIVTDFLSLRSYPTHFYSRSIVQDMFQETGLNVGEGVVILHSSLDEQWYFVQAQNYCGWVEKAKVAICTKNEMIAFLYDPNFIMVTSDKILIENVWVRMGQKFPLVSETENEYLVSFPLRNEIGHLVFKNVNLSKTFDLNKGYLQYTTANVLKQAFKMIGIPYSWGDKVIDGRDCSSTQNAVYSCFGFTMPRNTSNQRSINGYATAINSLNESILKQLKPGTLIYSSGHVLMYIGENDKGVAYVFHNTSSGIAGCKIQSYNTYTTLIIAILKIY